MKIILIKARQRTYDAKRAIDMKASETWRSLPAIVRGRVHEIDIRSFGADDPFSLNGQLDMQVQQLLAGKKRSADGFEERKKRA